MEDTLRLENEIERKEDKVIEDDRNREKISDNNEKGIIDENGNVMENNNNLLFYA